MVIALPLLLISVLMGLGRTEVITPTDMCKLSIGSSVFNLTGLKNHDNLSVTRKVKKANTQKYTVVTSLCSYLDLESIRSRLPTEKQAKLRYTPPLNGMRPNVVIVKEEGDVLEAFDLAYAVSSDSKNWKASFEESKPSEDGEMMAKPSEPLVVQYNLKDSQRAAELNLSAVVFKFICFKEEDFDFFDQRLVEDTLVFQYNGRLACSVLQPLPSNRTWAYALIFLIVISIYGLFLDRDNERLVMTLSSIQGSIMTVIAGWIAFTLFGDYTGRKLQQDTQNLFLMLSLGFCFLAVGSSYFSRYISMFFVCVASSFALNCSILYAFCIIFQMRILLMLFYLGGLVCAGALLSLVWLSTVFREVYSFTIVSATTNSFYLCASLAYFTGWYVNIFAFNQFKAFGRVDSIQFKQWVFFLLQIAITASVVTFRVKQMRKQKMEAMAKNAGLFRKAGLTSSGIDGGYLEADRGDEEHMTVIAM